MPLIKCPVCDKEISTQAVSCPNCGHPLVKPKTKGVFSGVQKVGVAGAIMFTPWLWPVALYPSIVRKTLSIASSAKEANDPVVIEEIEKEKNQTSIAAGVIGTIVIVAVVFLTALNGGFSSHETAGVSSAHQVSVPITSAADLAKAIANYDGSRAQADAIAAAKRRY